MSRKKGQDKCHGEIRTLVETLRLNSAIMADDLELVNLLLEQEISRREFPTDALTRAKELAERLEHFNRTGLQVSMAYGDANFEAE